MEHGRFHVARFLAFWHSFELLAAWAVASRLSSGCRGSDLHSQATCCEVGACCKVSRSATAASRLSGRFVHTIRLGPDIPWPRAWACLVQQLAVQHQVWLVMILFVTSCAKSPELAPVRRRSTGAAGYAICSSLIVCFSCLPVLVLCWSMCGERNLACSGLLEGSGCEVLPDEGNYG